MNALIFAAGLGTRLKPITDTMPKALVPVMGKPLLQHLIEKLRGVGVTDIVVNVHHFASQIVDFLQENDNFGLDIRISDESDMLLETGGGLKKAARLFKDSSPILVHNVDILSNADIMNLYSSAETTTLLVSDRKTQRYLLFNEDDCLVGWTNIATGQVRSPYPDIMAHDGELGCFDTVSGIRKYAFSGIQVFSQELLPLMEQWEGKFSIMDFYLSVCDKVQIRCQFDPALRMVDVGKSGSIQQAEEFLRNS